MKTTISQIVRRILYHYPDSRTDKLLAFQIFRRETLDKPEVLEKTNPDTFARTWRRHKKAF